MMTVDARGLSCPEPVVLTRDALHASPEGCEVLVDSPAPRENVLRFAASQGCQVSSEELEDGSWRLVLSR
ncbi:sulfurtransferase TusA family protein [Olsenella urininfantis]|uniref:sulfurtransferase TusA family protein n=1 Tax=Olsenella urininfantis TaxID=1871033 RepID=UPI00190EF60A|nr:sulfurtransferase TusA family protein [Olsenella urininfantis]